MHPMVRLAKEAQVEAQVGLFGDKSWCKIVARFAWNVPYAQKSIWTHQMELLGEEAQIEAWFGLFGDSVSFGAR